MALVGSGRRIGPCCVELCRSMATAGGVVPVPEIKRYIRDCLTKVGANVDHASQMADLLAAADCQGHYSHGLNRLDMYVSDIKSKSCNPNAKPKVIKESVSTAWVDGQNSLGPVVGTFCMQIAINKARQAGVGWVVAKGSNHFGVANFYTRQALEEGMLGMSFTNTSPLMTPTRANDAALGTNPLSLAAPGIKEDSFLLDMATTAVAVGKIEVQRRKGEPIPKGWALGVNGTTTTDAQEAFSTGRLLPLGGEEYSSGYKGYGLGMLVEIFCGILGGSHFGPNIRHWMDSSTGAADLGQCFIVINPECFAPGFPNRMSDLMDTLRHMKPVDPSKPVMVAGDPEREHLKKVNNQGGVLYHNSQLQASVALAKVLGVAPMKQIS